MNSAAIAPSMGQERPKETRTSLHYREHHPKRGVVVPHKNDLIFNSIKTAMGVETREERQAGLWLREP